MKGYLRMNRMICIYNNIFGMPLRQESNKTPKDNGNLIQVLLYQHKLSN